MVRECAEYSPDCGIIKFSNPDPSNLFVRTGYCTKNGMYNIWLKRRFADKALIMRINDQVKKANLAVTGKKPTTDIVSYGRRIRIGFWHPGKMDLEDLVNIIEQVPALDSAWLRPVFEKLKEKAGLEKDDLPYLDCYSERERDEDDGTGIYNYCWFSAKGGTIFFHRDAHPCLVRAVKNVMTYNGVYTCKIPNGRSPALRFYWTSAKTLQESRKELLYNLSKVPGALQQAKSMAA